MKSRGTNRMVLTNTVSIAVDRALAFLSDSQRPDGEFVCMRADERDATAPLREDPSPLITTLIAGALDKVDHPAVGPIMHKARAFLRAEAWPGPVWRFWSKRNAASLAIPPSHEDTVLAAHVLQLDERESRVTRSMILGNRNRQGLFYDWILPRRRHLAYPLAWPALLHTVRSPRRLRHFFRTGIEQPTPGQVYLLNEIHTVAYLGVRPETQPAIRWIHRIVREGTEPHEDRYYQSRYPAYYFIVKCAQAGTHAFAALVPLMVQRLCDALDSHRESRLLDVDIAMAIVALVRWRPDAAAIDTGVDALLASQRADGSWPRSAFFHAGHGRARSWGCAALTTGFCIEALYAAGARDAARPRPGESGPEAPAAPPPGARGPEDVA